MKIDEVIQALKDARYSVRIIQPAVPLNSNNESTSFDSTTFGGSFERTMFTESEKTVSKEEQARRLRCFQAAIDQLYNTCVEHEEHFAYGLHKVIDKLEEAAKNNKELDFGGNFA